VFDREGRYGERFYCAAHYSTVRMYGWKKFDTSRPEETTGEKYVRENLLVPPASQQVSEGNAAWGSPYLCESGHSLHFVPHIREDIRVETIFFIVITLSFFIISLILNPADITDFMLDELIIGL
jgi:hypothetical protein